MSLKGVVLKEAALAAERTFSGEIDMLGKYNVCVAGTFTATATMQKKYASDDASEITGEATSTTADKLVDTAQSFTTSNIKIGISWVHNTTDDTWAKITAIDSTTQLSIDGNIMASGEEYTIERWWDMTLPAAFTAKGNALGEEVEQGVKIRIGILDTDYTSGTVYVRISR